MALLTRIARFAHAVLSGPRPAAEVWCRPATVLALRNRARAPACLGGWR